MGIDLPRCQDASNVTPMASTKLLQADEKEVLLFTGPDSSIVVVVVVAVATVLLCHCIIDS